MTHLIRSRACTAIYMGRMAREVYRDSRKATGTQITQTKALSKMKVMMVFPPERRAK